MENKIYGFIGRPAHDMITYLAGILINLGKRVLVVDHSSDKEIMSCFTSLDEEMEFFQYKNINYTSSMEDSLTDMKDYDYILIYQEKYFEEGINYVEAFVITDFDTLNLKRAKEAIQEHEGNVHLLIRDFCNKKLDKQYILKDFFELENDLKSCSMLELDYYDYAYRISMKHESYQEFQNISRSFKEYLLEISNLMAKSSNKILQKAYHKAERGKSIEYSFLE